MHDPVFGDNRIAGIPDDVLRTVVSYTHPSGFYVSPSVDWVPRGAFADHANTLRVPGYALLNVQTASTSRTASRSSSMPATSQDERYISDISV